MHPFKTYWTETNTLTQQQKLSQTRQPEGQLYPLPQNDNGAASKFKAQTGGLQLWPWVWIVKLWVLHIISLRRTFDPNLTRQSEWHWSGLKIQGSNWWPSIVTLTLRTHNNHADTRSRSQFKITGLSLEFRVHSVSPIPVEDIFFKLWSNVHLSETMCRINNSTMPTQGQGHSSRSWVWALNFMSTLYLLYTWGGFSLNFGQMFTCGTMCRTHNSAMGTQGQGHSSGSWVWALTFMSTSYLLYSWTDFLLILVKCLPQWNDVQNP